MRICGKRLLSVLMAFSIAVQMMFAFGVFVFADGPETPIVDIDDPKVLINGMNLILKGEIGFVYHVYVPKEYRDGYMELEFMDEEPVRMLIKDCPRDSDLRYTATQYLGAVELSEPITLTVYDKDNAVLATMTRSAEDYAKMLIKDPKTTDKEKQVAKALINYGHYAQLACSEANGWVIGEDFKATTAFNAPTVDNSVFDKYEIKLENFTSEYNKVSMALRLDYKTGIIVYIPAENKPYVAVNGVEVEVNPREGVEGSYEAEIKGINVLNLEDEYKITINDASMTLCALSYCKLAVERNTSINTIDAMRTLYEFYQATVSYNEK